MPHKFRSAVGRAVVHNDNLHVRHGHVLLEHAGDSLLDETLVVVRVDQNANEWLRHDLSYPPGMPRTVASQPFESIFMMPSLQDRTLHPTRRESTKGLAENRVFSKWLFASSHCGSDERPA